jgi:hypothetical protein
MTKNETERRGGAEPPPQVHSREDEAADAYGVGWLCFTTAMGLGLAVAAVFTTILPLSTGWRYLWSCACVATFLLSAVGLVLFFERPMKGDLHHGHR